MLALLGMDHIHTMNALKAWLTTVSNGVAMILFVVTPHVVYWPQAILMIIGAISGDTWRLFRTSDQAGVCACHRNRDRLRLDGVLLRPADLGLTREWGYHGGTESPEKPDQKSFCVPAQSGSRPHDAA